MTRASLEVLFARQAQGQAFLLLLGGGVLLGLLCALGGWLQLRCRWLGLATDALCALLGGLMALGAMLLAGDGLRLYALLGLALGALLCHAGVVPVFRFLERQRQKLFRSGRKEPLA